MTACTTCQGTGKIHNLIDHKCSACAGSGQAGVVFYAGIGARKTPGPVLDHLSTIAMQLALRGFALRSGAAQGADMAFEHGCNMIKGRKVIRCATLSQKAMDDAAQYHPNWDAIGNDGDALRARNIKSLHARNSLVMKGDTLDQLVAFVVCWTEGGAVKGGTGQALRIAAAHNIPVFNIAVTPIDALWSWLDGTA